MTNKSGQFSQKDMTKYQIHFERLDTDGDGIISKKDLKIVLSNKKAQEVANKESSLQMKHNGSRSSLKQWFKPSSNYNLAAISPEEKEREGNGNPNSNKKKNNNNLAVSSNNNKERDSPLKGKGTKNVEQQQPETHELRSIGNNDENQEPRANVLMPDIVIEGEIRIQIDDDIEPKGKRQERENEKEKEKEKNKEKEKRKVKIEGDNEDGDDIEHAKKEHHHNDNKGKKERKGGKRGKKVEILDEDDLFIQQLFDELNVRQMNFDVFLQLMTKVKNGEKTSWKPILDFTYPQERGILQSISGYALNFFGLNSNEESPMASSSFFERVDDPEVVARGNNSDDKSESATKRMIKQFSTLLGISDQPQESPIKPSSSKLSVSGKKDRDLEAGNQEIQIKVDQQEGHKVSSDESIVYYEDQPRSPKEKVLGISRSQSLLENFTSQNSQSGELQGTRREIHELEVEEIEGEDLEFPQDFEEDGNEGGKETKSKGKKKVHRHQSKTSEAEDNVTESSPTPKRKASRKGSKASEHNGERKRRGSVDQEQGSHHHNHRHHQHEHHQDEESQRASQNRQQEYYSQHEYQEEESEREDDGHHHHHHHGHRKRKNSKPPRHDSREEVEMGEYSTSYVIEEENNSPSHTREGSSGSDYTPQRSDNSDYSFNQITQAPLRDDYENYYYSSDDEDDGRDYSREDSYEDDRRDSSNQNHQNQNQNQNQQRKQRRRKRQTEDTNDQTQRNQEETPQINDHGLYRSSTTNSSLYRVLQQPKVHKFLIRPKETPFFMIFVVLAQLVLLALCFVYQGGIESLSINPFAGPSNSVLIRLGAQFAYCMRAPTEATFERFNISSTDDLVDCPSQHQGSFGFSSDSSVTPNTTNSSLIPTCKFSDVLQTTCGIAPFANPSVPDQGWRVLTSIFLHVGAIHLVIILIFEFRVAFPMEREIGSLRMALIFLISGVLGNAFALNMSPLGVTAGSSGAIMGVFALLFIDIFQNWPLLVSPRKNLFFLIIILIFVLGVGLFPFINNYSHFGGFVGGLLSGFIFVPSINFGKRDRKRKIILLVCSTITLLLLFFAAFYSFYGIRFDGSTCEACSYVECVPHDSAWCVGAGYA